MQYTQVNLIVHTINVFSAKRHSKSTSDFPITLRLVCTVPTRPHV